MSPPWAVLLRERDSTVLITKSSSLQLMQFAEAIAERWGLLHNIPFPRNVSSQAMCMEGHCALALQKPIILCLAFWLVPVHCSNNRKMESTS